MEEIKNEKLGYACINLTLNEENITVNRGMIQKTFNTKGLEYVSELIILNLKDLQKTLEWNEKNSIRNYRMSSDMFPWFSHYELTDLPKYYEINDLMKIIGKYIKKYKHKVSFHPGPFNCLASPKHEVMNKTIFELNQHSKLMDMMCLPATHFYNINIHVGGSYGNKIGTMKRFMDRFDLLDDNTKKRLTLENDDSKNGYTIQDLHTIYQEKGIPIVFDTLHYKCNPGDLCYEDAFIIAYKTWGKVIPEIHHSSSKKEYEDPKATQKSHADYIYEKPNTLDKIVYISFESKMKEKSILKFREDFK